MAARKCTTIPRAFSWVIPAQSIVTGVAIYSTVFVFKVGSKPFIFAVVAVRCPYNSPSGHGEPETNMG
jgi:C4-dicarboxylate transporter